uniref:Uncharacterized protein n=1 Tax=Daphnia galeata TaxID=27404 RepID=A0A8J2S2J9_9CRUS|nr:unnamed protein product [Daphnia galeata]
MCLLFQVQLKEERIIGNLECVSYWKLPDRVIVHFIHGPMDKVPKVKIYSSSVSFDWNWLIEKRQRVMKESKDEGRL